ncbi:HIT family protein [Facklamia sp. DSM 111018]|uniref:HIT family protein n=1 Tax=Facklamia lactis TaxID=2749967 RepID=A0ABS0LPN3_9LACT|nr:HIT family protein [Facklamia lactis]MBG9980201.1 HIT family protein [Facklamia lactis]MBG9986004.1 HIT family protein [Facklamia lactis]
MTDCIFCKIINGEIPNAKVYEDDKVYAFLDISQVTPGHTLLVPKKHVCDIFEYDEHLASEVFSRLPKIAKALQQALPDMKGLNILNNNREIAYQTVFHSHIHLIPRYQEKEGFQLEFTNNQDNYQTEEFQALAQKINHNFE